jgi:Skp family chaperone for outer membrane proteins
MKSTIDKASSVCGLKNLLEQIKKDPASKHSLSEEDLATQGALAKISLPELGIFPSSLNSLKSYAETYLDGGWEELDLARKEALIGIKDKSKKPSLSKSSKKYIAEALKREKEQTQHLLNEIARFAEQYAHLNEICQIHSRDDDRFSRQYKEHLRRYAENRSNLRLVGQNDT